MRKIINISISLILLQLLISIAIANGVENEAMHINIKSLTFSPSDNLVGLVALQNNTSNAETNKTSKNLFVVLNIEGQTILRGESASPNINWLEKPERLAYLAKDASNITVIVVSLTKTEQRIMSPPVKAQDGGAICANDDEIAYIIRQSNGKYRLCLWNTKSDNLSLWDIPEKFTPSLEEPPLVSQSGSLIATVNEARSYFIAMNRKSGEWLKPITVTGSPQLLACAWKWQPLGEGEIDSEKWQSGWEYAAKQEEFLLDDKARVLWVFSEESPMGVTPGAGKSIFPDGRLCALDLDLRQRVALHDEESSWAPSIWIKPFRGFSTDKSLKTMAVVYKAGKGRDCVLYKDGWGFGAKVLVKNDVSSDAVSIDSTGKLVTVTRKRGNIQSLCIISTENGKILHECSLSSYY